MKSSSFIQVLRVNVALPSNWRRNGVEVKVPSSRGQLQTLLGQTSIYRTYYGPNLVVVVFQDLAKYQDVNEFSNILRGRGIQVFVK